jgi:hypothetical protein
MDDLAAAAGCVVFCQKPLHAVTLARYLLRANAI